MKYASDGVTVISEVTVDYIWMMTNLPVYGDGITHYYHQGPIFIDDPDEETEQMLRWNPDEDTNVEEKDMGAVKGTNVKDLCDLVGGMQDGEELKVVSLDGWNDTFAYENVYNYSSREGPMVITWYVDGLSSYSGHYPDTGYYDGMRLVWLADENVNPWGINAFGNYDWYLVADPAYWYFYESSGESYPTTTGLSGKIVSEIRIFSDDPVPPPTADFSASIKTGCVVNGNFETGTLTPWTGSGATVGSTYTYKKDFYSVRLIAPASGSAWIQQDIDLTNVGTINFWRHYFGGSRKYMEVLVDDTVVGNYSETATVPNDYESIDITSYGFTGNHTLKFKTVNTNPSGSFAVYLDNIEDYGPGASGAAPLTIQFKDLSAKMEDSAHTSWAWDFQNDSSTDSNAQNPLYTYTTNGSYTVKLTATNANGSDTEIKVGYINVGEVTPPEFISFTVTDYNGDGIKFGNLDPGQSDRPADGQPSQGAVTITVGTETNVDVDVKVMGTDFTVSGNTITIGNVKYNDENDSGGATALTTSYVTWYTIDVPLTSNNVTQAYYWITIPAGQPAGDYTSTFSYKAEKASP